jgi:hypothetical protein
MGLKLWTDVFPLAQILTSNLAPPERGFLRRLRSAPIYIPRAATDAGGGGLPRIVEPIGHPHQVPIDYTSSIRSGANPRCRPPFALARSYGSDPSADLAAGYHRLKRFGLQQAQPSLSDARAACASRPPSSPTRYGPPRCVPCSACCRAGASRTLTSPRRNASPPS